MDDKSVSSVRILNIYSRCSSSSLLCQSCKDKNLNVILHDSNPFPTFRWCQQLSCPSCESKWFICTYCRMKHALITQKNIQEHNRYHHSAKSTNRKQKTDRTIPKIRPLPADSNSNDGSDSQSFHLSFGDSNEDFTDTFDSVNDIFLTKESIHKTYNFHWYKSKYDMNNTHQLVPPNSNTGDDL